MRSQKLNRLIDIFSALSSRGADIDDSHVSRLGRQMNYLYQKMPLKHRYDFFMASAKIEHGLYARDLDGFIRKVIKSNQLSRKLAYIESNFKTIYEEYIKDMAKKRLSKPNSRIPDQPVFVANHPGNNTLH